MVRTLCSDDHGDEQDEG
jgi:hypothetical protein